MTGDAYWEVKSDVYVHDGPPLKSSLFDDPERLRRSWAAALDDLRRCAATARAERARAARSATGVTT